MSRQAKKRNRIRQRTAMSTRRRLRVGGTRPRLSVHRSLSHIYGQIIDDETGKTLASASTLDKSMRGTLGGVKKVEAAERIGAALAEKAKASGVTKVVFDRGRFQYHGRVKALAEAARKGGLEF